MLVIKLCQNEQLDIHPCITTVMRMDGFRLQLAVNPNSGVPIFRQIVEQVRALAAGGRLEPGQMLPGVRQVAAELAVNPMTVSKAYSLLEAEGVVERVRGTGMRVTDAAAGASVRTRQEQLRELIDPAVERARQLGLNDEQVIAVLKAALREIARSPDRQIARSEGRAS